MYLDIQVTLYNEPRGTERRTGRIIFLESYNIEKDLIADLGTLEKEFVLGYCRHGVNLDTDFCKLGCRI